MKYLIPLILIQTISAFSLSPPRISLKDAFESSDLVGKMHVVKQETTEVRNGILFVRCWVEVSNTYKGKAVTESLSVSNLKEHRAKKRDVCLIEFHAGSHYDVYQPPYKIANPLEVGNDYILFLQTNQRKSGLKGYFLFWDRGLEFEKELLEYVRSKESVP